MKAKRLMGSIAIATIAIGSLALTGCSSSQTSASSGSASQPAAQVVVPVASNPIVNNATKPGLQVTSAVVENNVDPTTNQALSDRLQIGIKNTSSQALSDLELYYQMTDSKTMKTEGYYQKLTGFSIKPGQTGTVYFDNQGGAGHYPENAYSLYRTSSNEVVFKIQVSAAGYQLATTEVKKAVGTGEKAGG